MTPRDLVAFLALHGSAQEPEADIWARSWQRNREGWWVNQSVPGCVVREKDGRFHAYLRRQAAPGDFVADTREAATGWLEQQAQSKEAGDARR